jgi:glycosyltransferase involved in cell wall biosynthesis
MLVSIVTPSFNQDRYIEKTIQSVFAQDYPEIEYTILDGGSTDNTVDVIKKYEDKLAGWVSEKDRGQTDAINKGFARAKGDILAWINSDDTYEPGAVSAAVHYLQEHPDVGMVYADCNFIDESGAVIGKFHSAQTDYRLLRQGYTHIPQQTMFVRAALWKQVGPLDPSFYFAMDYDLWIRIAARARIKYIPQTWANFRLHTSGKTLLADDRCWPEMMRVHYRDGGSFFSLIVAKYYIRKLLAPAWNWRKYRMLNKASKAAHASRRDAKRSRWTSS